jgi:hypothetical protein
LTRFPDRPGKGGQSLVELLVVLPVLLLIMATIFPLLTSGIVMPWLDERLWLRQNLREGETLQSELEEAHQKTLTPPYFRQQDLEETMVREKLGVSFPLLGDSFPGLIVIRKILASHPEVKGPALAQAERSEEKITAALALLTLTAMAESEVPHRVKNMSVPGIFPWKIKAMKNLGLELFHLDLDALPEAKQ